jgi:hypothetical protein
MTCYTTHRRFYKVNTNEDTPSYICRHTLSFWSPKLLHKSRPGEEVGKNVLQRDLLMVSGLLCNRGHTVPLNPWFFTVVQKSNKSLFLDLFGLFRGHRVRGTGYPRYSFPQTTNRELIPLFPRPMFCRFKWIFTRWNGFTFYYKKEHIFNHRVNMLLNSAKPSNQW